MTFADNECPVWTGLSPTVAEDEMVNKENLSSCSSASERSSRLLLEVVAMSMLVWLDTLTGLSQSWGERHFFYHGYTERRFALPCLFSVNSHNSRYPENSGF